MTASPPDVGNRLLRALIEHNADGIALLDAKCNIQFAGPSTLLLLGYFPEDLVGRSLFPLVHAEDLALVRDIFARLVQSPRQSLALQFRFKHLDGSYRRLEASVTNYLDDALVQAIVFNYRDLTHRKKRDRELRDTQARLRLVFEGADLGIWEWDLATGQIFWTGRFEKLLGLKPGQFTGKWRDLEPTIPPEDYAAFRHALLHAMQHQASVNHEFRVLQPDGEVRWIVAWGKGYQPSPGAPHRLGGVLRDITTQKVTDLERQELTERSRTLAQKLLQVQEAERRDLALELHDELGQSLSLVKINLQIVREKLKAQGVPEFETCFGIVEKTIQQIRNLALDLRPSILDDLGLVEAMRWYLQRLATSSNLQINAQLASSSRRFGAVIETACFRIAQESLTNVVRHAQAKEVILELSIRDRELEVMIQDDGIGFDLAKAREKARRGGSSGLIGMDERARLVGGTLHVDSRMGVGTTLRLKIPLPEMHHEADPDSAR